MLAEDRLTRNDPRIAIVAEESVVLRAEMALKSPGFRPLGRASLLRLVPRASGGGTRCDGWQRPRHGDDHATLTNRVARSEPHRVR